MTGRLKKTGAFTAAGLIAVGIVGGFEGLRTKAYRDVVGVPTICFGETRGVKMGDTATDAQIGATGSTRQVLDADPRDASGTSH